MLQQRGPAGCIAPTLPFWLQRLCVAFVNTKKNQVEGKLSCVHLISVWTPLQVTLASTERAGGCPGRGEAGQEADSFGSDSVSEMRN